MKTFQKIVELYYKSDDGREFETEQDCKIWEKYFPKTAKEVLAPYIQVVPNGRSAFESDGTTWKDGFVIIKKQIPWEIDKYVSMVNEWDLEKKCLKKECWYGSGRHYSQQFVDSYDYLNCEHFPALFEYYSYKNKWSNRGAKWQIEDIVGKNTRYLKMWEK